MKLPQLSAVRGLLALFGSVASITGIFITFIVMIGPPSIFGGGGESTPVVSTPIPDTTVTTDEPTPPATVLETDPLELLKVTDCWLYPIEEYDSTDPDSVAALELAILIAGHRDFSGNPPVEIEENDREEPWSDRLDIGGEDDWVPENGLWVIYQSVYLDLNTEDLGEQHDIVVRVDPDNITEGFNQSKNDASVRVIIPKIVPSASEELVQCTSPVP